MFCRLCFTIVLFYNIFLTETRVISKPIYNYTNITAVIGQTIEITCSKCTESQKSIILNSTWSVNGKSLNESYNSNRFESGKILRITNIIKQNEGTYECYIYNELQNCHSISTLIVLDKNVKLRKQSYYINLVILSVLLLFIGVVLIFFYWKLRREEALKNELEANKSKSLSEKNEVWFSNLDTTILL